MWAQRGWGGARARLVAGVWPEYLKGEARWSEREKQRQLWDLGFCRCRSDVTPRADLCERTFGPHGLCSALSRSVIAVTQDRGQKGHGEPSTVAEGTCVGKQAGRLYPETLGCNCARGALAVRPQNPHGPSNVRGESVSPWTPRPPAHAAHLGLQRVVHSRTARAASLGPQDRAR